MQIAIFSDPHFGCKLDSPVFIEHHKKFLSDIFFPELDNRNIKKVICPGDFFDRARSINTRTLHEVKKMFIDEIIKRSIEMWIIPGNHDTYYKDSLHVTTIEEVLSGYENIHVITKPQTVNIGGRAFVFLPWTNQIPVDLEMGDVLCAHLDAVGFEQSKGNVNLDRGIDPNIFTGYQLVLSGHYHHPSSKGNWHYIGAPIEMKKDDFGGPRGFQILNTKNFHLEYIKNPDRIFRRVAYDDTDKTLEDMIGLDFSVFTGRCVQVNVKACKDRYILNQFIKKIEEANPFYCKVNESSDDLSIDTPVDLDKDIKDIALEYIQGIDLSVDKKELSKLFLELYKEAENVSTSS